MRNRKRALNTGEEITTSARVQRIAMRLGIAIAVSLMPATAFAQMEFSVDETEGSGGEKDQKTQQDGQAGQGGQQQGQAQGGGQEGGGGIIGDLAESGEGEDAISRDAPRPEETTERIFAIQRIFALRINRLELAPFAGFTVNDPFVARRALGLTANYWFTNVLAIGAQFMWYDGLSSQEGLVFQTQRATRLAVPITEWQLGAHLNFTYVPIYGKFSMFNEFIFQWDAYVVGGVGMMRTKPVPIIDKQVRSFDWGNRAAFNIGLGIRVFLTRWLTVFTEIRDYLYLEKLESRQVGVTPEQRNDPSTWIGGNELTNNVTVSFGLTVFFPFTFEYDLPK